MRKQPCVGGPSREAGFTLIEALAAMVILVFGIMAVANLIVVAISSNRMGSTSTAASMVATETIERLKAIPFTDLKTGGSQGTGLLDCDPGSNGKTKCQDKGNVLGCVEPGADCVVADNFNYLRSVPGVGQVKTRWAIASVDTQTIFIVVRSEVPGLAARRSRAEFATFRSCTAVTSGCPAP